MIVVGLLAYRQFGHSPSETAKVESSRPGAICGKVGVMAFAGGRSNLYGCTWGSSRHCVVWANGSAYDVTKTARTLFRAQGNPSPC